MKVPVDIDRAAPKLIWVHRNVGQEKARHPFGYADGLEQAEARDCRHIVPVTGNKVLAAC